jgi:hypothetical protein
MLRSGNLENLFSKIGQSSAYNRATGLAGNAATSGISSITRQVYNTSPRKTETTNKMAALAAFQIMDDGSASSTAPRNLRAMHNSKAHSCFQLSQSQLKSCISSASSAYALQACTRQHAISDIGECVNDASR